MSEWSSAGWERALWDFVSLGADVDAFGELPTPPAPEGLEEQGLSLDWLAGYEAGRVAVMQWMSLSPEEREASRLHALLSDRPVVIGAPGGEEVDL